MSIIRPWSARLVACQTFWSTGAPYWTWKCAWSWNSWQSSRPFQSSQYFNIRNALQYNYARKPHPLAGMVLRLKVQSKHLKSQLDPPVGDVTFLHHRRSVRSPCWLRTPQNCILARWSNLGLTGRRPALTYYIQMIQIYICANIDDCWLAAYDIFENIW